MKTFFENFNQWILIMAKNLMLLTTILSISLSFSYTQSSITTAEARDFIADYLDNCIQNKYAEFFDRYFDIEQDEDGFYLLKQFLYQYKILSAEPPWVEILASVDDPARWDRIYRYQLKKENNKLFIVPRREKYWIAHNTFSYQDERVISRPFSASDMALFKTRFLTTNGLHETDLNKNHPAFLGDWLRWECPSCKGLTYLNILKHFENFSFQPHGQFEEDGEWFVVDDRLVIRFPRTSDYNVFDFHVLKDSTLWLSYQRADGGEIGMHLIRPEQTDQMPLDTLRASLVPQVEILYPTIYDNLSCIDSTYLIFEQKGKAGLMDNVGNIILPLKYEKIFISDDQKVVFANLKDGAKVFDHKGSELRTLDYKFDIAWMNGQYFIQKNGKKGIADSLGNIVIEPLYDYIKPAGFANYQLCIGDQWGLVNLQGEEILPLEYEGLEYRTENLTIIKEGMHYGVMDTEKKELIVPIQYDRIKIKGAPLILAFKEDKAIPYRLDGTRLADLEYDYMEWMGWYYCGVEKNGKRGVINELGETVLPIKYDDVMWADLSLKGLFEVKLGEEEFIVDSTEMVISEAEFERRRKITEQLREIKENERIAEHTGVQPKFTSERMDGYYAIFNEKGQMVLPPIYGYPIFINDTQLIVSKGDYYGIIDVAGRVILPFIFYDITTCDASGTLILDYKGKKGMVRLK